MKNAELQAIMPFLKILLLDRTNRDEDGFMGFGIPKDWYEDLKKETENDEIEVAYSEDGKIVALGIKNASYSNEKQH